MKKVDKHMHPNVDTNILKVTPKCTRKWMCIIEFLNNRLNYKNFDGQKEAQFLCKQGRFTW